MTSSLTSFFLLQAWQKRKSVPSAVDGCQHPLFLGEEKILKNISVAAVVLHVIFYIRFRCLVSSSSPFLNSFPSYSDEVWISNGIFWYVKGSEELSWWFSSEIRRRRKWLQFVVLLSSMFVSYPSSIISLILLSGYQICSKWLQALLEDIQSWLNMEKQNSFEIDQDWPRP